MQEQKPAVPFAQGLLVLSGLGLLVGLLPALDTGFFWAYLGVAMVGLVWLARLLRNRDKLTTINARCQTGKNWLVVVVALLAGLAMVLGVLWDELQALGVTR